MSMYSFDSDPDCKEQLSADEQAERLAAKAGKVPVHLQHPDARRRGERSREAGRRFDVGMGVSRP